VVARSLRIIRVNGNEKGIRKVVCIVLLLGVLGCSLLPVTNFLLSRVLLKARRTLHHLRLKLSRLPRTHWLLRKH